MLVQHFGPSRRGQSPNLRGFFTQISRPGSQPQVKVDRLALQLAYFEFHGMSLRPLSLLVNAIGDPFRRAPAAETFASRNSFIPLTFRLIPVIILKYPSLPNFTYKELFA
jgi:hypothetical protein